MFENNLICTQFKNVGNQLFQKTILQIVCGKGARYVGVCPGENLPVIKLSGWNVWKCIFIISFTKPNFCKYLAPYPGPLTSADFSPFTVNLS